MAVGAHLITGGFPPGQPAGHDMGFVRSRLLAMIGEHEGAHVTTAEDFTDVDVYLAEAKLLLTYVAGPYPNEAENATIIRWLEQGGRWLGLHGTSGGKAARIEGQRQRAMVRTPHHDTLGAFFLNHPPIRRFRVVVANPEHPLMEGLPPSFEVDDELYLIEPRGEINVLLTTELPEDPSPPGFGFAYDEDTSLGADGRTRVLGLTREVGDGSVAYIALGHCHSANSNSQPFVDDSVVRGGDTPARFLGVWETEPFERLLHNAIKWGLGA
jgi:type 1 glutamine amidotransferase